MKPRYASLRDYDGHWVVPWVHWQCGHYGLVEDYAQPGHCPHDGAPIHAVSWDRIEGGHDVR